jgi:hypothetical protein
MNPVIDKFLARVRQTICYKSIRVKGFSRLQPPLQSQTESLLQIIHLV